MKKRDSAIIRIRVISGLLVVIALVLIGRLYQLQIIEHEAYIERGNRQYVHTVDELYDRGSIFFTTREGELVSAATIQSGYTLALNPSMITDASGLYETLSSVIPLEQSQFISQATLPNRTYVEIDQQVSREIAERIDELSLDGVSLYRNQWRYYPAETVAARTIGFVGFSQDESEGLVGRYGLERYYNDVLVRPDERMSVNLFAEVFSNVGEVIGMSEEEPSRAGDVVTSLEPTVSRYLDEQLAKTHEKWGSKLTGGIIINPQDGSIYAMNAAPTFDSNNRSGVTIRDFQNPLVEDVYELGSIIKPLTVAAGLDDGAITANSTYYDSGELELNTFTIRNYDGRGRGQVDMQEVLSQSLNTGVAYIVDTMGKDTFRQYFKALKLGNETGVDMPNETFGLVANLDSPRDVEYATASFGQGIALTPMAAVRALATLGNGGQLVTPHLAREIRYEDGEVQPVLYPPGAQVFTEETSMTISRMLTNVVDDALAGGAVALPNHSVAAKTGTAQIADQEDGGYYEDKFLHSFFGYFPSYDPQFLVFLYTVEPQEVRFASETLTEPFMDIATFLINYYNVPPDR